MEVLIKICDVDGACSESESLSIRVCEASVEEAERVTESILDRVCFCFAFVKTKNIPHIY